MIRVRIDTPNNYYWNTITKKLKITVEQGVRDVARLACERAARSTYPSGTSNKTKESLHKSIYKDVNYAYLPVANKNLESEDGDYLLAHRNNRGRVPSNTKQKVITFADYDRIKERLVRHSGMAKAGYLQAARKLKDSNRIPVWLRKEINLSTVSIQGQTVMITNHVRYASNLITDRQLKNLMENAFKGLIGRANRIKL